MNKMKQNHSLYIREWFILKKFIISLFIIGTILFISKDKIVIPKEALRIRIIASSNDKKDQDIKYEVKNNIESDIYNLLKDIKNINEARNTIKDNIGNIDTKVGNILNKYHETYKLNYGYNYFPAKEYKGIKYEDGLYESLVVTIGEGKGDNWWCVMFPPFCLMEAENNNTSEVEYKIMVKELLNKYFK